MVGERTKTSKRPSATVATKRPTSNKKSQHRVRKRLTIRDRLGQLTLRGAERLLGEHGAERLRRGHIMSNAGATGLNLQAANTVINVDLPWNPAVLEQRIGSGSSHEEKNPDSRLPTRDRRYD